MLQSVCGPPLVHRADWGLWLLLLPHIVREGWPTSGMISTGHEPLPSIVNLENYKLNYPKLKSSKMGSMWSLLPVCGTLMLWVRKIAVTPVVLAG